jgi:stage IV sporulation protein FB
VIRIGGKIPIVIYPSFWILAAVIAFLFGEGDFIRMAIWVVVIFVSVLFHELGHALTALFFGRHPRIELVAMGGLTFHDGEKLSYWKQFFITFNGPFFGFLVVVAAYLVKDIPALSSGYPGHLLTQILVVNVIWTVVNLLPILPLDGGQLLRLTLERFFAFRGLRLALGASAILSLVVALVCFLTQNLLAGAVFFLFAYENFNNFRQSRYVRASDQSDLFKKRLAEAEMELRQGEKDKALIAFEALRQEAKEGIIFDAASQYASLLHSEKGESKEAYEMLLPLKERLAPDALELLHRVAFEQGNFALVEEIAGAVFQYHPGPEIAVRTAFAAAHMKDVEGCVGWLQTAVQGGVENLHEICQDRAFDEVRESEAFKRLIK